MGTSPSVLHITEFVFDFFSLQTMLQYFFFAVATKLFKRCNFLSLSFLSQSRFYRNETKLNEADCKLLNSFFAALIGYDVLNA